MEGMLFLVREKLWGLISTLPLISERTSILPGGTAAQITLKGTQSPLVLSSKHSRLTVAVEWAPKPRLGRGQRTVWAHLSQPGMFPVWMGCPIQCLTA